jgi:spore coat polysaccharide biosynthesis predicted glycosyltransferase SpsG
MSRAPVLFRVNATAQLGHESFYRCLTYAAALQRRRRSATFVSCLEPVTYLASSVRRGGNEVVFSDHPAGSPEDLEQTLREVYRVRPEAIIVDLPEAGEAYLRELRASGTTVISMDSLAVTPFPSHMVINPLMGLCLDDYELSRGTQLLCGERYALVRPEIRRIRPIRAAEPPQPFRVIVALGDDDFQGQALQLGKQLVNCPMVSRVDVLVRPYHPDLETLKSLAEKNKDTFGVATEPSEFPVRMSRSHLAVTAGNAWSLELACVGIPQLMIVQAEKDMRNAQHLDESGAATLLGTYETVNASALRTAVTSVLDDQLERVLMARAGRKLIDARGSDRMVTALELLLQSRAQRIGERLAA